MSRYVEQECAPTPDMQAYIDDLKERFPDPDDRMRFIEAEVERSADYTVGFVDPDEPDDTEW